MHCYAHCMDAGRRKPIIPNQARNFRMEANLHQRDVAFLLDIKNVGRISEWENGTSNPSLEHLITLSLIYQKLPDQIYYELRKHLARKLEVRLKLLKDIKDKHSKGVDSG